MSENIQTVLELLFHISGFPKQAKEQVRQGYHEWEWEQASQQFCSLEQIFSYWWLKFFFPSIIFDIAECQFCLK